MCQMPISVTCNNHYALKCTYSWMERSQAWLEARLLFGKVGRSPRVILGGVIMNCLSAFEYSSASFCGRGKQRKDDGFVVVSFT